MPKIDLWKGIKKITIEAARGALYHNSGFSKEGYCLMWPLGEPKDVTFPVTIAHLGSIDDIREWIAEQGIGDLMGFRYEIYAGIHDRNLSWVDLCILWTTEVFEEADLPLTIYMMSQPVRFENIIVETYTENPDRFRFPYKFMYHYDEELSDEAQAVWFAMRRLVDLDYPLTICRISDAMDMGHFAIKAAIDEIEAVTNYRMRDYDKEKRKYRLIRH